MDIVIIDQAYDELENNREGSFSKKELNLLLGAFYVDICNRYKQNREKFRQIMSVLKREVKQHFHQDFH